MVVCGGEGRLLGRPSFFGRLRLPIKERPALVAVRSAIGKARRGRAGRVAARRRGTAVCWLSHEPGRRSAAAHPGCPTMPPYDPPFAAATLASPGAQGARSGEGRCIIAPAFSRTALASRLRVPHHLPADSLLFVFVLASLVRHRPGCRKHRSCRARSRKHWRVGYPAQRASAALRVAQAGDPIPWPVQSAARRSAGFWRR